MKRASLRWPALVLVVAIGAATWLRAGTMADRALWYDEAYTWYVAGDARYTDWLRGVSRDPNHPPLSFMAVWVSMKLFGSEEEWAVRAPSVAAGVALVPALFALGTAAAGPNAGAVAALLAAVAPNLVDQGRDARMFSMLALLEALCLAAAIALLGRVRAQRTDSSWLWVGLGLVLGAMVWTNYLGLAVCAGVFAGAAAWMLIDSRARNGASVLRHASSRLALTALIACLTSAPAIAPLAEKILAGGSEAGSAGAAEVGGVGAAQTMHEIVRSASALAGGSYVALLVYALALVGLIVIARRNPTAGAILIAVGLAGIAFLFPMRQRHPFLAPRYLTVIEPVVWLGTAAAISAARGRARLLSLGALGVIVAAMLPDALDTANWAFHGRSRLPRATAEVAKRVGRGELVVFHPEFNRIVGYYYGLPRKHPLQMALYADPLVAKSETLAVVPRPPALWIIGSYSAAAGIWRSYFDEQRAEIEAIARWYGHPDRGRQLAQSLQPGDTFVARFDATGAGLRVVDDASDVARLISELQTAGAESAARVGEIAATHAAIARCRRIERARTHPPVRENRVAQGRSFSSRRASSIIRASAEARDT